MRTPTKVTALMLTGAVGVASAAYGLGSQAGDGSATARSGSATAERGFERGAPPGFDDLAEELGVDADQLEDALRDFHDTQATERRDDHAKALADALGVSLDKVKDAFGQLQDRQETRLAGKLARALGLEVDRVKSALDKLAGEKPDEGFAEALAAELGVEPSELEEAFESIRPDHSRGHRGGMPLRTLADALGVTRPELRKALRELRQGERPRWERGQDELAKFLAERFDLSAEKVEEALGELPGPRGGPGHGGPGGPPPGDRGPRHGGPGGPPGGQGFGPGF